MGRYLKRGGAEYAALFDGFEHVAFRLETLQHYQDAGEDEPLRRFLAGGERPDDPDRDRWAARVRTAVAAGKIMQRVHVVVEPLTAYLHYELAWSYTPEAGEDIRIIPVEAGQWPAGLPGSGGDFWLFDSARLLQMHYDPAGRLTATELVDDPSRIAQACRWRDAALSAGVPLPDYLRSQLQRAR